MAMSRSIGLQGPLLYWRLYLIVLFICSRILRGIGKNFVDARIAELGDPTARYAYPRLQQCLASEK